MGIKMKKETGIVLVCSRKMVEMLLISNCFRRCESTWVDYPRTHIGVTVDPALLVVPGSGWGVNSH